MRNEQVYSFTQNTKKKKQKEKKTLEFGHWRSIVPPKTKKLFCLPPKNFIFSNLSRPNRKKTKKATKFKTKQEHISTKDPTFLSRSTKKTQPVFHLTCFVWLKRTDKKQNPVAEVMAVTSSPAVKNAEVSAKKEKKHRSKCPEVRVIGGRIYDPQNGKTCHQVMFFVSIL